MLTTCIAALLLFPSGPAGSPVPETAPAVPEHLICRDDRQQVDPDIPRNAASFSEGDSLLVLFWNLENFFDWRDGGGGEADREFSAAGPRHWTRRRFMAKASAIAKTLLWTAGESGALPDIFAVAEVENAFVLRMLLQETALRKTDYAYVHFDSPDRRGIDTALLYRRSRLRLRDARPVRVTASRDGDTLQTRDILLARFETAAGQPWTILVNHHPSKFGGGSTAWKREAAVERLRSLTDSLFRSGDERVIATGDFNDTPDAPVFRRLTDPAESFSEREPFPASFRTDHGPADGTAALVNLAGPLARRGLGTIRYEGNWELIDMFFVPPALAGRCTMEILAPSFLTVRDNVHSGDRPFRTWLGPRYIGGVSDHRPILLRITPPQSPSRTD